MNARWSGAASELEVAAHRSPIGRRELVVGVDVPAPQEERLLELEDHRDDWTVYVRPELVVEIAFDGVQRSPRYPGGVALRFARVLRYRDDKPAAEADTIASVRDLAAD